MYARFMSRHGDFSVRVLVAISMLLVLSCEGDTIYQTDDTDDDTNPVPQLTSLSPAQAVFGGSSFTLSLTGSRFIPGSIVIWNGAERATQYVSATQVTATILASDIALPQLSDSLHMSTESDADGAQPWALLDDSVQVWVRNPAPGGGTSGALPFTRQQARAQPYIDSISPGSSLVGGPDVEVDVYGGGFYPGAVVRWGQSDLVTTYESDVHLSAVVPAANLSSPDDVLITVFVGPPGGGTSNSRTFRVVPPNPVPTVAGVAPGTLVAGGFDFVLTVTGTNFVPGCEINWNGSPLTTSFLGSTTVSAQVTASAIADGKTVTVSVTNPEPGGGTSNTVPVVIENPVPTVTQISPGSAATGSSNVEVTVDGSGFVPSSVARWDGAARPTNYFNKTRLWITVSAADLASAGTHNISVFNPAPAGGASGDMPFTTYTSVAIRANDIIYDPGTGHLFVSVPSSGGAIGNSITAINPTTGAVVSSVFVGSEPTTLARSDDGQYLYVALDGAAAVRRYVIATETAELQFALGTDPFYGPLKAEDIVAIPGSPGTIAVSLVRVGVSPRHGGVSIYDDGVRRTTSTQDHTGSNRIEPGAAASRLYGFNNETTEFGFRHLTISVNGVTQTANQRDLISGFGTDITFSSGKVFATTGTVINAETFALLGTLAVTGPVAPDPANGKVFVIDRTLKRIVACNIDSFLQVGELGNASIGAGSKRPIRFGTDGLAFIASTTSVIILHHPLFGP